MYVYGDVKSKSHLLCISMFIDHTQLTLCDCLLSDN